MEVLAKLFGSDIRVRVMRLFLCNPDTVFDKEDVAKRCRVQSDDLAKELRELEKIGLITKKKMHGRPAALALSEHFLYLVPLQNLLVNFEFLGKKEIAERFVRAGKLKLVVVSGVFIQNPESRIDLLIVGDKLKRTSVENAVKALEADMGKELRFAYLETDDFTYRMNVYDKLVRDVLDYPHKKLLNKLGI